MSRIKVSYGFGEDLPFQIAQQETREAILNRLHYNGPMTVNQLSQSTGIGQSVIHGHVRTLTEYEIIKEVDANEKRKSRVERYYDLNIPTFTIKDQKLFQEIAKDPAQKVAETMSSYFTEIAAHKGSFDFEAKGWDVHDPEIARYLFIELSHAIDNVLTKKGTLRETPPGPERKGKWRGYLWAVEYQESKAKDP